MWEEERCSFIRFEENNWRDVVYDPFMGIGTTAVVAKKLKRKYLGSEISKSYLDLINKCLDDINDLLI